MNTNRLSGASPNARSTQSEPGDPDEIVGRITVIGGTVVAGGAVPVVAVLKEQIGRFAVADGIDDLLQAEFGGQMAFPEPVTSPYEH
ncbi:hypothetical protein [Candidatus Methylocalor cossyra]|uniref:hypothetical protein n=1 Tax=Candidatus Methylocalor cossyra TaxID=3108543 RepID=UPI0032B24105